jgi:hypothetical protein
MQTETLRAWAAVAYFGDLDARGAGYDRSFDMNKK